jgi:ERCC4-type nuclease
MDPELNVKNPIEDVHPAKRQKAAVENECMLVADNRERTTQDGKITLLVVSLKAHRPWEPGQLGAATLPLGDFIFVQNEHIRYILERKTIPDLIASIGDKRLDEQESRLILAKIDGPQTIVGLIIEGTLPGADIGQYNVKHIQNQLWQLSKYDLQVIYTKDLEETCNYVCYMRWSLSQEATMEDAQKSQLLSMAAYATKKKGMEPKDTYPKLLKSIPGVSAVHVNAIMEKCPTMLDYIGEFSDDPRLFEGLVLTEKRKIGRVLSEKMHKYTFNTVEEI